jgi:hypothetical protein
LLQSRTAPNAASSRPRYKSWFLCHSCGDVREKRESKNAVKVFVDLRYGFISLRYDLSELDQLNDLDAQQGQHCVLSCFCKLGCMIWSATVSMVLLFHVPKAGREKEE